MMDDEAMVRIAVLDNSIDLEVARVPEGIELVRVPEAHIGSLPSIDGLIVGLHRIDATMIRGLPTSVRVIARAGIGVDNIDLDEARRRGISVINQPDYGATEVATHAAALVLACSRQLRRGQQLALGAWPDWSYTADTPSLADCRLGIVGFGRIGQEFARLMRPYVGEVVALSRRTCEDPDVRWASSLDELLSECDIVSLHVPLTPGTRNLIGARELALMPSGAIIVNVSRGGLIDEEALAGALKDNHLAGAGLDVLSSEPPSPENPLLNLDNVVLSPHAAWVSRGSTRRLAEWSIGSVADLVRGLPLAHGNLVVDAT